MKYNQPYGVSDPTAVYINGNPSTGTAGSIPPAASIEYPQREIVNLITHALLTPDNADLHQLAKAVQTQRPNWATDTGTADAAAIALDPAPNSYTIGLPIRYKKMGSANATSTPSVNVNGLGAKTLINWDGSALVAATLPGGCVLGAIYDGTAFRLTTPSGSGGGAGGQDWYGIDTGTGDVMLSTIAGLTVYTVGNRYFITKAAFANTIATPTLNISGLGAKTIVRFDGTALEAAELPPSSMIIFEYDGTNMRVLGADRPSTKVEAEAGISNNTFISPLTLFQRRTPFFTASGNTPQGIPAGVDTKVNNISTLSGSMLNSGSSFTTSQFTCGTKDAGIWLFMGYAALEMLSAAGTGKDYRGAIAKNGVTGSFMSNYVDESSTYGLIVTTPVTLVVGDVITLSVFQSTNATRNIVSTQLVGWRIGGAV